MSSRDGPVARQMTDGSDFKHRETVASQYSVSVVYKGRLSFAIILHWMVGVLAIARLSHSLLTAVGARVPAPLRQMNLPAAQGWELVWLLSLAAAIAGKFSLNRNNISLLSQYLFGQLICGVGALLFGTLDLLDELRQYLSQKEFATVNFLGVPFVFLQYLFIVVMLQVHFLGIFSAWKLRAAWRLAQQKKRL